MQQEVQERKFKVHPRDTSSRDILCKKKKEEEKIELTHRKIFASTSLRNPKPGCSHYAQQPIFNARARVCIYERKLTRGDRTLICTRAMSQGTSFDFRINEKVYKARYSRNVYFYFRITENVRIS